MKRTRQNTSSAVMQQRQESADSLDDFPTMPWGTRALIEHVISPLAIGMQLTINRSSGLPPSWRHAWEPACNRGYMARPLAEYFEAVLTSDVHDYGWSGQEYVEDFLFPGCTPNVPVDWVITNPPFRLAEQFIAKACSVARVGCAMLVRTSFLEGVGRYERIYSVRPPTIVAQFVERLPMVKGRVDPKVSSATSYAWLVWADGVPPLPTMWIPPCRKRLERDTDYPTDLA